MAETATPNTGDSEQSKQGDDEDESIPENRGFDCNICLETAKDAVVSVCGHLFCWPCLHRWLESRPHKQTCPVCKAGISRDKVIPLYGRGADSSKDPRDNAPPRPAGQRPEPEQQQPSFMNAFGFNNDNGIQFHFGIGAFPFGFFTLNNVRNGANGAQLPPELDRNLPDLMRYLLMFIIAFFYWKLFFG